MPGQGFHEDSGFRRVALGVRLFACRSHHLSATLRKQCKLRKEDEVKVNLVCFSKLANEDTCDYHGATVYDLPEGRTVADLARVAGIAPEDVKIAFVNRRISGFDTRLRDGDRVGLAPAVGGM